MPTYDDPGTKKVPQYAAELEQRLNNEGPLSVDDVRMWLTEQGAQPRQINLVLGHGSLHGKRAYYKDGAMMMPGPRPVSVAASVRQVVNPDDIPTVDEAMNRPTGQSKFQGLLESLGVTTSQAKIAANFCYNAFDMENPEEVWAAMRECPQIGQPVIKKQIWRLWTKTLRVDPPERLVQEVTNWGKQPPPVIAPPGRKFFVIDGEVVPTTPDDSEGLTMSEAVRLATLQRIGRPKEDTGGQGSLVTTLLQQQGETERKRLDLEVSRNVRPEREGDSALVEVIKNVLNKPPDTSFEGRIEAQRREFEARMEAQNQRFMDLMAAQGERSQHMLEMVQTQNGHALEMIRLTLEGNNERPSFIDEIEKVLSSGLIEKLKPAPPATALITGPNGSMSLEVYKAINEMQFKSEALAFGKEQIPELVKMGVDMAQATRELAASRGHDIDGDDSSTEQGDQQVRIPAPTYIQTDCGHCSRSFRYPEGAKFLVCPYCRASQTPDGQLIVPQGPPTGPKAKDSGPPALQEIPLVQPPAIPPEEPSPMLLGRYYIQPAAPPADQHDAPRQAPEAEGELAPVRV